MVEHPVFAIVGHPNKGKSSIVATLAEDESVAISPDPGTTTSARGFQMRSDGKVLYELVDTPGFQRPRAALAWLQSHERNASDRARVVREFVEQHAGDSRFKDECELLRPILDGAGILYVVDGAHPYGAEYEAEMEILRWTGRPRMALINLIGPGNHVDEWRSALNQYFSIVRVFDAVRADFAKRLELLRAFRELGAEHEGWPRALDHALETLQRDRATRRTRAAAEIADLLVDILAARVAAPAPEGFDHARLGAELIERLQTRIRQREAAARRAIQDLYHHRTLQTRAPDFALLAEDLFSQRSFAVFGLSPTQLSMTGAATGAVAGGVIDLALGGASLLLGAGIGALAGGLGALLGSKRLAKVEVLGSSLGGFELSVGPITSPNLPWVVLGRSLLHHRLVAELNHARREALILDADAGVHLTDRIEPARRRRLSTSFARIRDQNGLDAQEHAELVADIDAVLQEQGSPAPENIGSRKA